VLARAGRGHGAGVVEDAVRLCVQEGFRPNIDVIFGMPGEGEPEALATVTTSGRVYGSWQRQEEVAEQLVSGRSARAGHRMPRRGRP